MQMTNHATASTVKALQKTFNTKIYILLNFVNRAK